MGTGTGGTMLVLRYATRSVTVGVAVSTPSRLHTAAPSVHPDEIFPSTIVRLEKTVVGALLDVMVTVREEVRGDRMMKGRNPRLEATMEMGEASVIVVEEQETSVSVITAPDVVVERMLMVDGAESAAQSTATTVVGGTTSIVEVVVV